MFKFFKKLILVFTYGVELETVLENIKKEKEKVERESRRHNLYLCFNHRQEQNRSHYSEHNCDYCKLEQKYKQATKVKLKRKHHD